MMHSKSTYSLISSLVGLGFQGLCTLVQSQVLGGGPRCREMVLLCLVVLLVRAMVVLFVLCGGVWHMKGRDGNCVSLGNRDVGS